MDKQKLLGNSLLTLCAAGGLYVAYVPSEEITEQTPVKSNITIENKVKHLTVNVPEGTPDSLPYGSPIANKYAYVTSVFGMRKSPISGNTYFHDGWDIANVPKETPVRSTMKGIVVAGKNGGRGNFVQIYAEDGRWSTEYCHNEENAVKTGQYVERGDVIAYVGSTGVSNGPHCHYTIRDHINSVDPKQKKFGINLPYKEDVKAREAEAKRNKKLSRNRN